MTSRRDAADPDRAGAEKLTLHPHGDFKRMPTRDELNRVQQILESTADACEIDEDSEACRAVAAFLRVMMTPKKGKKL